MQAGQLRRQSRRSEPLSLIGERDVLDDHLRPQPAPPGAADSPHAQHGREQGAVAPGLGVLAGEEPGHVLGVDELLTDDVGGVGERLDVLAQAFGLDIPAGMTRAG